MPEHLNRGALILSTDASAFETTGDTAGRMHAYTALYGTVYLIVCAKDIPQKQTEVAPRVHVHPCAYRFKPVGFARLLIATFIFALRARPEAIISQDAFMLGAAGMLVARTLRIPLIASIYGTDVANASMRRESLKHRLYAYMARIVLRQATAVQTDGHSTVARLRRQFGAKIFFKPVFPSNLAALSRIRRSVASSPFRVMFVGRFVPQKNIPLLIDVIEAVLREGTAIPIKFSIIGNGPQKDFFTAEVARRGLGSSVDDAGVLSRDDIIHAYATHHVLLLTSLYEGFPKVFMEAAVSGMPIITTDVDGVQDLVEDGATGIVVPQGTSADALARRIIALSKDPATVSRMSSAIKERWQTLYGNKTVLDYQRPIAEYVRSSMRS